MLCTQSMTNVTSPQFNVASFLTFTTIYLRNHQPMEFSYVSSPKPWIAYRLPSLSQHQKKNTWSSGRNSWTLCDTPANLRCSRYAKMPCIFESCLANSAIYRLKFPEQFAIHQSLNRSTLARRGMSSFGIGNAIPTKPKLQLESRLE